MSEFIKRFEKEKLTIEEKDKIETLEVSMTLLGYSIFVITEIVYFTKDNNEVFCIYSISDGYWVISSSDKTYKDKIKKFLDYSYEEISLMRTLDILEKIM